MAFLRRDHPDRPAPAPAEDTESPAALRARLDALVARVHSSSGRLPVESVVAALTVTDTLADVIAVTDLDVHALVALQGILDDYLPTTITSYLALDPTSVDVQRPSGQTPRTSLLEQVEALWLAASDLLTATRARDADALLTQGSFLRTKFSGSDLDL